MKRISLFFVYFLTCNTGFTQSAIDVLHYRFELNLCDENDRIYGETSIKLRFLQTASSISFDLVSMNILGKGMKADKVVLNMKDPLDFKQRKDKLDIFLAAQKKPDDSAVFTIYYHGVPADGLIISRNNYGDRTFFSDNWPNRAHQWVPCVDNPADKATFEFLVTAPANYQVISNGSLVNEKALPGDKKMTHWVENVPLPTKVMVIGVARFAVKTFQDSPPNVPISAWVYPQDSVPGFTNYSVAPAIVKFFSDYIGPYPYNKLANVQSKTIFGGMENASAIFYEERSAQEKKSVEDLLAHEIAHQWFGDMLTEKSFPHLWLSEGFATYLTLIYLESRYGADSMINRLREDRQKVIHFVQNSGMPVVDSVSPFMDLLSANSYEKGAWVLHMLRGQIGDSLFHCIIRSFYSRFKGGNAQTEDFVKVVEEITGEKFKEFFRQWLYVPSMPQLKLQWQYDTSSKQLFITVTQSQKQIFKFPLDLEIVSNSGKSKIVTVQVMNHTENFSFSAEEQVRNIKMDPNTRLLFDGEAEKKNL